MLVTSFSSLSRLLNHESVTVEGCTGRGSLSVSIHVWALRVSQSGGGGGGETGVAGNHALNAFLGACEDMRSLWELRGWKIGFFSILCRNINHLEMIFKTFSSAGLIVKFAFLCHGGKPEWGETLSKTGVNSSERKAHPLHQPHPADPLPVAAPFWLSTTYEPVFSAPRLNFKSMVDGSVRIFGHPVQRTL